MAPDTTIVFSFYGALSALILIHWTMHFRVKAWCYFYKLISTLILPAMMSFLDLIDFGTHVGSNQVFVVLVIRPTHAVFSQTDGLPALNLPWLASLRNARFHCYVQYV